MDDKKRVQGNSNPIKAKPGNKCLQSPFAKEPPWLLVHGKQTFFLLCLFLNLVMFSDVAMPSYIHKRKCRRVESILCTRKINTNKKEKI